MLFWLASSLTFIQDFVVKLQNLFAPAIMHNLGKIEALKRAFHQVTIEQLEGSYFEFGVFEGTSLLAALTAYERISSPNSLKFYKKRITRNFYGFDSFEDGFKYNSAEDRHPFFAEGEFVSSYEKCQKRFRGKKNVKLIKGYFEDTVGNKDPQALFPNEKCAILFIDCDLTSPTRVVLEFMSKILVRGSIIILDDYYAYNGDPKKGPCGAFADFLTSHPNIKVRDYFAYGYNGHSFIVYDV